VLKIINSILKSPNGIGWKLGVNDAGLPVFNIIQCQDWQLEDIRAYAGEVYNPYFIGRM
jgi:hypothetical protein